MLARLLVPEDFGLLGIAMRAIATLETFSQTGFQAALIQKKDNVCSYYGTFLVFSGDSGDDACLRGTGTTPFITTMQADQTIHKQAHFLSWQWGVP